MLCSRSISMKKMPFIFMLVVVLAVFILLSAKIFKSSASDLNNCKVYMYEDKFIKWSDQKCLDKVLLVGVYFLAKDQVDAIPNWSTSITDIMNQLKTFYEGQFYNKISIMPSGPYIVHGDKNWDAYVNDLHCNFACVLMDDIKNKISFTVPSGYVPIYLIYPKYGGQAVAGVAALQTHDSLDPESTGMPKNYGYNVSAHELGHTFGIPHPWEEAINKDENGNIINPLYGNDFNDETDKSNVMSYANDKSRPLSEKIITQEVKNQMIVASVLTPTPTLTPTSSPTPTPTPTPSITPTPTPTCYWWMTSCQPTPTPTPTPITSKVEAVRFSGDPKVYVVQGTQIKWVPNPDVFNSLGLNWTSVEVVPTSQKTNFQRAKLLRAENDEKVFYITEGGLKRHIPSVEAFNSYGNLWQDVVVVKDFELSAISDNQLIRQTGDSKVYKLENGQKHWIETAETFNRLGLNWAQIAPVNSVEINSYPEGSMIE